MSKNIKFSSYLSCLVYENSELMCMNLLGVELILGGKKLIFWADFLAPKSGHRREKQPVLGPV